MSIGFINDVSQTLSTKEGFFLTKDLKLEDEALLRAVALSTNDDIEILANKEAVYKTAEEYAHAGIKILNDKIESTSLGGSFWKHFEKDLYDFYDKFSTGK